MQMYRWIRGIGFSVAIGLVGTAALAAGATHGAILTQEAASFEQDQDVKCLQSALASGNPETGPSTFLLKATPGCLVPWHFHTAAEQLIVTRGKVMTEMQGMKATTLQTGGYAMMPGKVAHQFTCTGAHECLMYVMFDQKYDITWGKGP
jgi:quercetin dioxygenase-like cupin family protein